MRTLSYFCVTSRRAAYIAAEVYLMASASMTPEMIDDSRHPFTSTSWLPHGLATALVPPANLEANQLPPAWT